mgnify:CR=1 FL=1
MKPKGEGRPRTRPPSPAWPAQSAMPRATDEAPKVRLEDVAARLLGYDLPASSTTPILAKRSSTVRKIDEAKQEEKEALAISRAKKMLATHGHLTLRDKQGQVSAASASNVVLEKSLRKIATRGVVQLFNAVRTAQKDKPERKRILKRQRRGTGATMNDATPSAPLDLSRDSFLDILRRGSHSASVRQAGKKSNASFLNDDFMLGDNKTKHWGKPLDDNEDDDEDHAEEIQEENSDDDEEEEP